MRLIKTELWERLIFDEDCTDVFKTTDGKFVTANINLHVCDEAEVSRLYNEFNAVGFTILKEGTHPAKRDWIGVCQACSSVVKAHYSSLSNIAWNAVGYGYATCPFCQQINMKFIRRPIDEKENEFERMTEHTFIFKNGEYSKENCEYCRELETDNWHYYKCEDGSMLHVRKDAIAAIKGGTYDDIIKNK